MIFRYKSSNQPYEVALWPGKYMFECIGASGGSSLGGAGAYVSAVAKIKRKTTFYVYVGQKGTENSKSASISPG